MLAPLYRNARKFRVAKSFHEKAGWCQGTLSLSSFRESVPIQPSRLCRHPSIRTLCWAIVARCKLGVLDSVGAATCESTSVPPFRRELVQDLSQSPDLGGRARLFGYHLSSYFFAPVSFFLPFPVFHREISSQDRPGTTIANSVDP